MKNNSGILFIIAALSLGAFLLLRTHAADPASFQRIEFATVRWQGRENTCLIRPNGKIEKLRPLFDRVPRPEGVDERAYYLSVAMNTLAREGYELAGITADEIVLKRALVNP